MKTNPAHAALHFDHLADHERAVHTIDAVSALYRAVSFLVHGDTFAAMDALHRLDDDVVALAATVGTYLSIGAQQVLADRANPLHLPDGVDGSPLGAGRRRAL
jgi:hypothetical protein